MHTYIVKYKHINIKIAVENKDNIINEAKTKLHGKVIVPENVVTSVFDTDFKEYFIIDDLQEAPEKGIIKLEDREEFDGNASFSNAGTSRQAESSNCWDSMQKNCINNEEFLQSNASHPQDHSNAGIFEDKIDLYDLDQNGSSRTYLEDESINSVNPVHQPGPSEANCWQESMSSSHTIKQWPTVFKIPVQRFQPTLRQALASKQILLPGHQRMLIQHLYEAVISFTTYPTPWQYKSVIVALLSMYPHLGNGLSHGDAETYWRHKLSHKFRNMRRTVDSKLPEVECMREKIKLLKTNKTNALKEKMGHPLAFGCANFLPAREETEDDASIAAHIEYMKMEVKNKIPDHLAINISLQCTFPDRRRYIISECPSIQDMKEQYPCLFDPHQLIQEFNRINGVDLAGVMTVSLKKYASSIIQLAHNDGTQMEGDEYDSNEVAMSLLPKLMREPLQSSTSLALQECGKEPMLILNEADGVVTGQVIAEDVVLCEICSYFQGLCVLFAACYAFNTHYNKKHRNTLCFTERVLIGMDGKKLSPFIMAIVKKLNEKCN